LLNHTNGKHFLINDADTFCVSREIPAGFYAEPDVLWSGEIAESRPHESPYPKLAFQPPYFMSVSALSRFVEASRKVITHPITPYVDWWMNAVCHEAGLRHKPFVELEHAPRNVVGDWSDLSDPWRILEYHIRHCGAVMMHPIKTKWQMELCLNARKFYEG
jgi:hypothetical protein